jgi:nucleotide-binding universal stress UspA family protein
MLTPKTVLLHLNDRRRAKMLLDAVLPPARLWSAHVIGVGAMPPAVVLGAGMPGAPNPIVLDQARREAAVILEDLKLAFEAALAGSGCLGEWRVADAKDSSVSEIVLREARTVDLVFALQSDPNWSLSDLSDVAETLVFEGGRPVLIVPNHGNVSLPPKRVVLAWDGGREAARAAADAVGMLIGADAVKVVTVGTVGTETDPLEESVLAALQRHNVRCHQQTVHIAWESTGANLLSAAHDFNADLLVMGGYGHSRLREMFLGGVTQHVLDHARIPVLMSH